MTAPTSACAILRNSTTTRGGTRSKSSNWATPLASCFGVGLGQISKICRYPSFSAFYPHYIHEHSNRTCRRIHVVGSALVIVAGLLGLFVDAWWFLAMPLVGYGFAWVGHFFFEKNRPATFKYPLWSLMGDWRMFFETVTGKRRF